MATLTLEGQARLAAIAARHGVSTDAAAALLEALIRSGGTMAQFHHPELGGSGQWMQGGMTMVGDMFNSALKAKVEGLCSDLAQLLASQPPHAPGGGGSMQGQGQGGPSGAPGAFGGEPSLFIPADPRSGRWWPEHLGPADATGSQNQVRYAYFAGPRRLAIESAGRVTLYDTADHAITGVSQQQDAGGTSITFTSQKGRIPLSSLRVVTDPPEPGTPGGSHGSGGTQRQAQSSGRPEPERGGAASGGTASGGVSAAVAPSRPAAPGAPAAPPSSAGGFSAESLAGSVWRFAEAGGAPLGELRLEADGTVAGATPAGVRYWAVEDDALWLYGVDGRPVAQFTAIDAAAALPTITGRSLREPATAYLLIAPAPQTDRLAAVDGETVTLGLRIPLTETAWRLTDAGGTTIAELRLLPDGRIEGGTRPTEAGWRVEDNRLLLLHASGRPTARFDTFQIRDGGWTLRGISLSNGAEIVLTQRSG